jgi:hypothetical protein
MTCNQYSLAWCIAVALAGCMATEPTYAQISSENVDRHFVVSARAAALADAIVSDASDVASMYWNPSLLSFLHERSVVATFSLERIRSRDNIMNENVAVPLIHEGGWGLGVGVTYSHIGHIEAGSPLFGYKFSQAGIDLSVARTIAAPLSLGIGITTRYGWSGSRNASVVSSVIGVCYQPAPEITYGVSYQGIGSGIEYNFDPMTAQTTPDRETLSQSLQLGVTMKLKALEDRPVLLATVTNQKIFGSRGIIYKGGLEVWPVQFLACRIGYWVGQETVAARFGGALRIGMWQVDYAASTTELEPQFHQLALSYCFSARTMH